MFFATLAGAAMVLGAAPGFSVGRGFSRAFITIAEQDSQRSPLDSPEVAVSADGRFVAFASYAQLVPADTNAHRDVYVVDRSDGHVSLESIGEDGIAADADSRQPSISADGAMLVYESCGQIWLRDRTSGTTKRIAAGEEPSISDDGRVVVFDSREVNVIPGTDANGEGDDIYSYEVTAGRLQRISVTSAGVQPSSGGSVSPRISADGRYVVFGCTAPLTAADRSARPPSRIYLHDNHTGTTSQLSQGWAPAISADGRFVAFVSGASNLVPGDRNRSSDVFIVDTRTGAIELVSRSAGGGSANGASVHPALSGDGRFVAFQSTASDLICKDRCGGADEDINLLWDVFLFDRNAAVMTRISADAAGSWMEASAGPALDAAATVIAFSSRHAIGPADTKNDFDLFITQLDGAGEASRVNEAGRKSLLPH